MGPQRCPSSAEGRCGTSAPHRDEAPIRLEEDLGRPGPPVVGTGHGGGIGARIADGHEVAPPQGRQGVLAEVIGRFADRSIEMGGDPGAAGLPGEGAAERCQGDDVVAGAVQGRPDQLGHARVEDDLAAASFADVEDAPDEESRARHECPAGLDREAEGPSLGGQGIEKRRHLASKSGSVGGRLIEGRIGKPPPTSSVSKPGQAPRRRPPEGQGPADGVAPRIDRTQLRADVEVDPSRLETPAAGDDPGRGGELVGGHPEL